MVEPISVVKPNVAAKQITKAMVESKQYALDIAERYGITSQVTTKMVKRKMSAGYLDHEGKLVLVG